MSRQMWWKTRLRTYSIWNVVIIRPRLTWVCFNNKKLNFVNLMTHPQLALSDNKKKITYRHWGTPIAWAPGGVRRGEAEVYWRPADWGWYKKKLGGQPKNVSRQQGAPPPPPTGDMGRLRVACMPITIGHLTLSCPAPVIFSQVIKGTVRPDWI
jgi:hypothetical protein